MEGAPIGAVKLDSRADSSLAQDSPQEGLDIRDGEEEPAVEAAPPRRDDVSSPAAGRQLNSADAPSSEPRASPSAPPQVPQLHIASCCASSWPRSQQEQQLGVLQHTAW